MASFRHYSFREQVSSLVQQRLAASESRSYWSTTAVSAAMALAGRAAAHLLRRSSDKVAEAGLPSTSAVFARGQQAEVTSHDDITVQVGCLSRQHSVTAVQLMT